MRALLRHPYTQELFRCLFLGTCGAVAGAVIGLAVNIARHGP